MANAKTTPLSSHTQFPTRVALYARVSTTNGQNPEMQLAELRPYVVSRGWTIVEEYTDMGVSGSKDFTASAQQTDGGCSSPEV